LRSLPRAFVSGIPDPAPSSVDLPADELKKFRNVLRLSTGAEVAILPGDGRVLRARLSGQSVDIISCERPDTEANVRVALVLAFSKPEAMELAVRMATELGVAEIILFASRRSVVKWDASKLQAKLTRLATIVREACEVSYRTHVPPISVAKDLADVLDRHPDAVVLSEREDEGHGMPQRASYVLVIGPEGGWAPDELTLIGKRGVTLGPRVLRVATAVSAACTLALHGAKVS